MASLADNVARAIKVFGDIKNAIIKGGVLFENNTPVEEYPDKIDQVFGFGREVGYGEGYAVGNEAGLEYGEQIGIEKGKQSQYDDFAEYFCTSGERKNGNWVRAFANAVNLFPYLKGITIQPTTAYQMFYGHLSSLEGDLQQILDDNDITIDFSKCETMQYCFGNTNFTRIGVVDTSSATIISQLFFASSELVTVDKLIPNEAMPYTPYAFQGCYALKNIEIEGTFGKGVSFKDCPLSKDSIISIFNALSTTVTDKTLTLNKSAVNKAFGINVNDISTYTDEWKSLTESKKNWNIAYA